MSAVGLFGAFMQGATPPCLAPFLDDIGMDMTNGMLPGILGDLGALNPVGLFGAFMQGATPGLKLH